VTDISNQDVKDKVSIIKNICDITGSISPDNFKLRLAEYVTPEMSVYKELEACIFSN